MLQINKICGKEGLRNPYLYGAILIAILLLIRVPLSMPRHPIEVVVPWAAFMFIAFGVGYSILRPLKTLVWGKFLFCFVVLMGVMWFIEGLAISEREWLVFLTADYPWLFFGILPLLVPILLNVVFLKYLFRFDTRPAILMGILIGMIDAEALSVCLPIVARLSVPF